MTTIEESLHRDASLPVKTILIVEDDHAIGAFLELAIRQETLHHPFITTGVVQAREAVQQIKPDLLLLDYYLSQTTGLALYDELHALAGLEHVPALLLTAANLSEHDQEIAQRHIRVMSKPIDLDELLETINTLLA